MESKECCRCGLVRPAAGFSKDKSRKDGLYPKCKECHALWRAANSGRINADKRKRYAADPAKYLSYCAKSRPSQESLRLQRQYGITLDDYNDLLSRQGGVCAICQMAALGRKKLSVDHCHATGRVRGLLCQKCNVSIGMVGDDAGLLRRAIEYLQSMEVA